MSTHICQVLLFLQPREYRCLCLPAKIPNSNLNLTFISCTFSISFQRPLSINTFPLVFTHTPWKSVSVSQKSTPWELLKPLRLLTRSLTPGKLLTAFSRYLFLKIVSPCKCLLCLCNCVFPVFLWFLASWTAFRLCNFVNCSVFLLKFELCSVCVCVCVLCFERVRFCSDYASLLWRCFCFVSLRSD